jgi:hypothetical protein
MSRTTRVVTAIAVMAVAVVAVGLTLTRWHPGADTRSGTGLTYEGRFYWASGARVNEAALGPVVATSVTFQDTTADLRSITGFPTDTSVAALLPSLDGSPGGLRWTFLSTDQDRGTNPAGYDETRAVLATP